MLKRFLSISLVLVLTLAMLPLGAFSASAAKTLTIDDLQKKYPDGKYWNGGDAESYTDTPCTHHSKGCSYSGSCGCNTFKNTSIQCMGFANQLAYLIYGGNPYYEWTKYYGDTAFDMIKPGDIVRYKNSTHSVFVCAVDSNSITVAECNADGHCKINWNVRLSKETVKKTFSYVARAPFEWSTEGSVIPSCNCSESYAGEYKCITENYPLNVRAGHGSSYAKVGEIPKGATVTVSMSDGNWAHVTYGSVNGYASMEYLELVKPASDVALDKNIMNLDIPHNSTETVAILKSDNLPGNVKYSFEYDKSVISLSQNGDKLNITALKAGETDLVINVSDADGIIISVKCGVFIENSTHTYGSYISDGNATSEKDGTKTRICSICKAKDTVTDSGSKLKDSASLFTDVGKNDWYKHFVDYAVTHGIFSGVSETEFSPETSMTRAQFVQVLANVSEVDTSNKNVETGFDDVKQGAWYAAAVKWAVENGVAGGMGNGTFEPETEITREQMCVMLVNYVENYKKTSLEQIEQKSEFRDDGAIADWAKEKVYKCQMADLVNGTDNNNFDPKSNAIRAQGATIFTQFHKDYI